MTPYRPRDTATAVKDALADMPVVVLTGMGQTGKSTFLQKEPGLRRRRYVSFDDFAQLSAAREDPDGFVATDEPVTIDEAQNAPRYSGPSNVAWTGIGLRGVFCCPARPIRPSRHAAVMVPARHKGSDQSSGAEAQYELRVGSAGSPGAVNELEPSGDSVDNRATRHVVRSNDPPSGGSRRDSAWD